MKKILIIFCLFIILIAGCKTGVIGELPGGLTPQEDLPQLNLSYAGALTVTQSNVLITPSEIIDLGIPLTVKGLFPSSYMVYDQVFICDGSSFAKQSLTGSQSIHEGWLKGNVQAKVLFDGTSASENIQDYINGTLIIHDQLDSFDKFKGEQFGGKFYPVGWQTETGEDHIVFRLNSLVKKARVEFDVKGLRANIDIGEDWWGKIFQAFNSHQAITSIGEQPALSVGIVTQNAEWSQAGYDIINMLLISHPLTYSDGGKLTAGGFIPGNQQKPTWDPAKTYHFAVEWDDTQFKTAVTPDPGFAVNPIISQTFDKRDNKEFDILVLGNFLGNDENAIRPLTFSNFSVYTYEPASLVPPCENNNRNAYMYACNINVNKTWTCGWYYDNVNYQYEDLIPPDIQNWPTADIFNALKPFDANDEWTKTSGVSLNDPAYLELLNNPKFTKIELDNLLGVQATSILRQSWPDLGEHPLNLIKELTYLTEGADCENGLFNVTTTLNSGAGEESKSIKDYKTGYCESVVDVKRLDCFFPGPNGHDDEAIMTTDALAIDKITGHQTSEIPGEGACEYDENIEPEAICGNEGLRTGCNEIKGRAIDNANNTADKTTNFNINPQYFAPQWAIYSENVFDGYPSMNFDDNIKFHGFTITPLNFNADGSVTLNALMIDKITGAVSAGREPGDPDYDPNYDFGGRDNDFVNVDYTTIDPIDGNHLVTWVFFPGTSNTDKSEYLSVQASDDSEAERYALYIDGVFIAGSNWLTYNNPKFNFKMVKGWHRMDLILPESKPMILNWDVGPGASRLDLDFIMLPKPIDLNNPDDNPAFNPEFCYDLNLLDSMESSLTWVGYPLGLNDQCDEPGCVGENIVIRAYINPAEVISQHLNDGREDDCGQPGSDGDSQAEGDWVDHPYIRFGTEGGKNYIDNEQYYFKKGGKNAECHKEISILLESYVPIKVGFNNYFDPEDTPRGAQEGDIGCVNL